MAAHALAFTADIRCFLVGLAGLAIGALTFLTMVVLSVVTPAISGAWLVVPALVMVTGLAAVLAWLVFGGGAQRVDPSPAAAEQWQWQWGTEER